jgi:hypothetical protein
MQEQQEAIASHIETELEAARHIGEWFFHSPSGLWVSSVMTLHNNTVVPLYHTFFLTFLFYFYVVIQRRNISTTA